LGEVTKFIKQKHPNGNAIGHCVDLASIVDVKRFCDDWQKQNKRKRRSFFEVQFVEIFGKNY